MRRGEDRGSPTSPTNEENRERGLVGARAGRSNFMEIQEDKSLLLRWVSVLLETGLFPVLSWYLAICFLTWRQAL